MPFINVKLYRDRLDSGMETELISRLTDAVADVFGDAAREHTWVVLDAVPRERWGIAGKQGSTPASQEPASEM